MLEDQDLRQRMTRRMFVVAAGATALTTTAACATPATRTESNVLRSFKSDAARTRFLAAYDAVLAEWPVAFEELYLQTRFGKTHVIASGPRDAPPLLLMPALLTSATMWRPNVASLSQHFRTYAIDVIGEPNKSEATRSLRNRRDCAAWLSDVFSALGIARASIVGSSLGGFFALNQALLAPETIEQIVLISPPTFPISWRFYYYVTLSVAFGKTKPLDDWMGNGVAFDPVNTRWAAVYGHALNAGRPLNSLSLGSIDDTDQRRTRTPALLLIGDKEVIYDRAPTEVLQRARERIVGLEGELVPDANHLAAMVNPDYVNERILRFLQSPRPSPSH